jgi:hypothetical protein
VDSESCHTLEQTILTAKKWLSLLVQNLSDVLLSAQNDEPLKFALIGNGQRLVALG